MQAFDNQLNVQADMQYDLNDYDNLTATVLKDPQFRGLCFHALNLQVSASELLTPPNPWQLHSISHLDLACQGCFIPDLNTFKGIGSVILRLDAAADDDDEPDLVLDSRLLTDKSCFRVEDIAFTAFKKIQIFGNWVIRNSGRLRAAWDVNLVPLSIEDAQGHATAL